MLTAAIVYALEAVEGCRPKRPPVEGGGNGSWGLAGASPSRQAAALLACRLQVLALLEAHAADLCSDAPQDAVRHLFEVVRDRAAAPGDAPEAAARLQLAALHALTTLLIKLDMPQRDAVSAGQGCGKPGRAGGCVAVSGWRRLRSCVIALYVRQPASPGSGQLQPPTSDCHGRAHQCRLQAGNLLPLRCASPELPACRSGAFALCLVSPHSRRL